MPTNIYVNRDNIFFFRQIVLYSAGLWCYQVVFVDFINITLSNGAWNSAMYGLDKNNINPCKSWSIW